MSYSVDFREHVLGAIERGVPHPEVISVFGIGSGTLKRWLNLKRTGRDLAPISPPGPPPAITPDLLPKLRSQLAAHPDATLAQHAELWNTAHGTSLSQWTIGRAVRALDWTRKKSR